jgi:hypothetical protein
VCSYPSNDAFAGNRIPPHLLPPSLEEDEDLPLVPPPSPTPSQFSVRPSTPPLQPSRPSVGFDLAPMQEDEATVTEEGVEGAGAEVKTKKKRSGVSGGGGPPRKKRARKTEKKAKPKGKGKKKKVVEVMEEEESEEEEDEKENRPPSPEV